MFMMIQISILPFGLCLKIHTLLTDRVSFPGTSVSSVGDLIGVAHNCTHEIDKFRLIMISV